MIKNKSFYLLFVLCSLLFGGAAVAVSADSLTGAIVAKNQEDNFSCDNENDRRNLFAELNKKNLWTELTGVDKFTTELSPVDCLGIIKLAITDTAIASLETLKGLRPRTGLGMIGDTNARDIAAAITSFIEKK